MRLEQLIHGDDSVQQHIASEREKQALEAISPMARRAIEKEVLPQINPHVTNEESVEELWSETKKDIEIAFRSKSEIYTRLIQYKTIDQSDDQFLEDLLAVMDEWLAQSNKIITDGAPSIPGQVKVKIEVESDVRVKTDAGENTEIEVMNSPPKEKLPISVTDIFELGDLRW